MSSDYDTRRDAPARGHRRPAAVALPLALLLWTVAGGRVRRTPPPAKEAADTPRRVGPAPPDGAAERPALLPAAASPPPGRETQGRRGHMLAAFAIAVYQVAIGLCAGWTVVDLVFGEQKIVALLSADPVAAGAAPDLLRALLVCIAGAVIGGVMNGLFFLQFYAAERGQFSYRYAGSYLLAPIAIGLIGLAAFALVTGGIVVFATAPSESADVFTEVNLMAYLALGIVSGVAWQNIMARIQDAAENIFGKSRRAVSARTAIPPPAAVDAPGGVGPAGASPDPPR